MMAITIIILNSCTYPSQAISKAINNQHPTSYPCHRIDFEQIQVYPMQAMINSQMTKSKVTGTGSMLPLITPQSTILYKQLNNKNELCVGDIVYYNNSKCINLKSPVDVSLHRIIDRNEDINGTYYTLKGDNNGVADDCRIRFEDIRLVVVGIIY